MHTVQTPFKSIFFVHLLFSFFFLFFWCICLASATAQLLPFASCGPYTALLGSLIYVAIFYMNLQVYCIRIVYTSLTLVFSTHTAFSISCICHCHRCLSHFIQISSCMCALFLQTHCISFSIAFSLT